MSHRQLLHKNPCKTFITHYYSKVRGGYYVPAWWERSSDPETFFCGLYDI